MFYDVYCKLCEENGEKPFSLPLKLGMKSNSAVAQWKNGSISRVAMLEKIADYFGVTVRYLLDGEEKEKPAPSERDGVEDELIRAKRHRYTPHSCRHTFATMMKRVKGADKDKLALIGHTSQEMLRHYQDVSLDDLRKVTDAL